MRTPPAVFHMENRILGALSAVWIFGIGSELYNYTNGYSIGRGPHSVSKET